MGFARAGRPVEASTARVGTGALARPAARPYRAAAHSEHQGKGKPARRIEREGPDFSRAVQSQMYPRFSACGKHSSMRRHLSWVPLDKSEGCVKDKLLPPVF